MKNKIFQKLSAALILLFSCFLLCGCDPQKPYLTFNAEEINAKTVYNAQKHFQPGQTVNYALFMPKGFKQEYLRMQIIKRPDNIPQGGMTIYSSNDLYIDKNKKYYIDKFVIRQPGCYVVRFFYGNTSYKPFAENILWVDN